MLTGTHLLQSCGIVLCEIETAEHQEQLFAINFNCFNTLKPLLPPPLLSLPFLLPQIFFFHFPPPISLSLILIVSLPV